jgi:hypothetical protein
MPFKHGVCWVTRRYAWSSCARSTLQGLLMTKHVPTNFPIVKKVESCAQKS